MESPSVSKIKPGIKKRMLRSFAVVTVLFIALFLVVLPFRFYQRDVDAAKRRSIELSEIIKESLLSTMMTTRQSTPLRNLIRVFQDKTEFEFRLIRNVAIKKQKGVKEDNQTRDDLILQVLKTGKGKEGWLKGTQFRYVSPYLADRRCQSCHQRVDGVKINPGEILGVSEIVFELKDQKYKSIRFIIEITIMITVCLVILGAYLFTIVKLGILDPLSLE